MWISGVWTGYYTEPHQPNRGWMHLFLEFGGETIRGEGTDYVGPWTLFGKIAGTDQSLTWTKQYVGKHAVSYFGTISGEGIKGTWRISDWLTGGFHIWPANRYDLYLAQSSDQTIK